MRPIASGLHIPGVTIREEIGRGADSVVYLAEGEGVSYALKVQRTDNLSGQEADSKRRFHAEASVLARVPHRSLPEIMEIGEADGRAYIIMEHLAGRTLATAIKDEPLPERTITRVGRQLALALGSVHRRGLVHRDVKPHNVVLLDSGEVKLIDFGFVERRRSGADASNGDQATVGTFRYSAPEQMGLLKRPVDGRADLYALGVLLFEAVAGRPPFLADDPRELLRQHAAVRAPKLRTIQPSISPGFEAVVGRLLSKDPDDRYQSGEALAADLDRLDEINAAIAAGRDWSSDGATQRIEARQDMTLVGRHTELHELQKHWAATRKGSGRAIVVQGPAGVGKSRLVREFLGTVVQGDALVLKGKCATADPTPFGPLRAAIDEWLMRARPGAHAESRDSLQMVLEAAGDAAPLLRRLSPQLAAVLPETELPEEGGDSSDQFYEAVARFFAELARLHGQAVLFVDDLQLSDEATLRILRRLVEHLVDVPLMVVLAVRSDAPSLDQIPACLRGLADRLAAHTLIGPLDEQAIAAFVQAYLGDAQIAPSIVTSLTRYSGGIPFALSEYLHALIAAGLLKPHWGSWILDERGIDTIALPRHVLDLVERRIAHLPGPAQQVLAAAAVVGDRFSAHVVGCLLDFGWEDVESAIAHALSTGVVTPAGGDEYVFVHDRLRESLLDQLEPAERRIVHEQIAVALEKTDESATNNVYAIAHHRYLGANLEQPESLGAPYQANVDGARAAAAAYAFDQAYLFYRQAAEIASKAGLVADPAVERAQGQVCAQTGHLDEAVALFDSALANSVDPFQRADVLLARSQVAMGRLDTIAAKEDVDRGLEELAKSPVKPRRLALGGLLRRLFGLKLKPSTDGPTEISPSGQLRCAIERMIFRLHIHHGEACYFNVDRRGVIRDMLRTWRFVSRFNVSSELVQSTAMTGTVMALVGLTRLARRLARRAKEMAQQLRDPIEGARARLHESYAHHFMGRPLAAEKLMLTCLRQHGAWLDNQNYLSGVSDLVWNLTLRGYARQARDWLEAAQRRVELARVRSEVTLGHTYRCYAGPVLAMLGNGTAAAQQLADFCQGLGTTSRDRWRRTGYLAHSVLFCAEQGETGEAFDELVRDFGELGLDPRTAPLHLRQFYLGQVLVRLLQYQRARAQGAETVRAARAQFREALAQFSRAATHPTLRAHLLVIRAKFARIEGRRKVGHKLLIAAEAAAWNNDNAWVSFEVAQERARWLLAEKHDASARREVETAYDLAVRHGWGLRASRVRKEFGLDTSATTQSVMVSSAVGMSTQVVPSSLQTGRHFESLLRVSLASAGALDSAKQARAALDELIAILGAERGFLFLRDDDGSLSLQAGRDSSGNELAAESDYSHSAIERVCVSHEPIVLSGMEHLDATGSSSVVIHNLRSVVAAPLLFRERVVGAVYLDNRLARGVFTEDDVAILMAIANHIAIAVETGRAAQVEAQARADRAERRLAERMQTLGRVLNSTLDLDDLLTRFLASLGEMLPMEGAAVLLRKERGLRVAVAHGFDSAENPAGRRLQVEDDAPLAAALESGPSVVDSDSPGAVALDGCLGLGERHRWVVAPLTSRGESIGVLLVAARTTGDPTTPDLGQADAQVVFASATQAATAVENARLFGSVQRQANTDGLTGARNRRFFMRQAEQSVQRAAARGTPLSLAMIDVDFFKKINDEHGHMAGDEVLRQIVKRIASSIRAEDLLGRYGGEEFALLLTDATAESGLVIADRLRRAIEADPVMFGQVAIPLTVSVGLAALGDHAADLPTLIGRADAALYQAKQTGRNRVALDRSTEGTL